MNKMLIVTLIALTSLTTFARERSGFCSVGATLKNGDDVSAEYIRFTAQAPDQADADFTNTTVAQTVDLGNGYTVSFDFMAKLLNNPSNDLLLLSARLNNGANAVGLVEEHMNARDLPADKISREFNVIRAEIRNAEAVNASATDKTVAYVLISCMIGK